MDTRTPPPCPHCLARPLTHTDLSVHLRFTCPVIRPKESAR